MSPCPQCDGPVIHIKLRCSGRSVMAEPTLQQWINPNTRNPRVRVVTTDGTVIVARRKTPECFHLASVDGWAIHKCDELFRVP